MHVTGIYRLKPLLFYIILFFSPSLHYILLTHAHALHSPTQTQGHSHIHTTSTHTYTTFINSQAVTFTTRHRMRPTTELVRIWTEALVPVCNNSKSHASQELKWLLQHAKHQSRASLAARSAGATVGGGGKDGLSEKEVELMQGYVDERVRARKPLQYILGKYGQDTPACWPFFMSS